MAYILAAWGSVRLAHRWSIEALISVGLLSIALSCMMSSLLEHSVGLWVILLLRCLTYAGWGLIFGNATAQIVSAKPECAGLASALMIAGEMVLSCICVAAMATTLGDSLMPLNTFLCAMALLCACPLLFYGAE